MYIYKLCTVPVWLLPSMCLLVFGAPAAVKPRVPHDGARSLNLQPGGNDNDDNDDDGGPLCSCGSVCVHVVLRTRHVWHTRDPATDDDAVDSSGSLRRRTLSTELPMKPHRTHSARAELHFGICDSCTNFYWALD